MIPTLQTERLTLRPPRPSDFEAFAVFYASERSGFVGGPLSRTKAWGHFCGLPGHWVLLGYGRWVAADRDTDEPLGAVGPVFPESWPEPEIAWTMFAAGEGRGLAFEAAQAARRHVYDTLGWRTAISLIDPDNARSVALGKRLGCTFETTFAHPEFGTMHIWRHPAPSSLSQYLGGAEGGGSAPDDGGRQ